MTLSPELTQSSILPIFMLKHFSGPGYPTGNLFLVNPAGMDNAGLQVKEIAETIFNQSILKSQS